MKIKTLLFLLMCIGLWLGCSKKGPEAEGSFSIPEHTNKEALPEIIMLQNNDTLIISDQVRTLRFRKQAKAVNFLKINNKKPQVYTLQLQPLDTLGNIRFSQVLLPDGTSDGPFGTELTYNFEFSGTYIIKMAENMMSGDPWEGDVVLTVKRK